MNLEQPGLDLADDVQRGAVAGVVAAMAMAVAMGIDMALTRQPTNEFRLLGGLVPGLRRLWPVTGPLIHLGNGASLGAFFGWVQAGLPGSPWARGLLVAELENVLLWPVLLVLAHVQPKSQRATIQRFNSPGAFVAEVFRHAVYGIVLGLVFDRLAPRRS